MNATITYFREALYKLKLVTWPKQDELLRLTTFVVIFVLIASGILGLVNFGFSEAYKWLLTLAP